MNDTQTARRFIPACFIIVNECIKSSSNSLSQSHALTHAHTHTHTHTHIHTPSQTHSHTHTHTHTLSSYQGFFNFCPNLKKALAINRVKMVTTLTVSSFFFVLLEFKYFFLMQHVFSG